MIVRSRLLLPVAAIALAFAFALPAAFADGTSKDSMSKDSGMKKDSMSKGQMSKDSMSKDENEGQNVEVTACRYNAPGRIPRPGTSGFAPCHHLRTFR